MIYDRFQTESIDYINQGFSVLVSAPTGAGKTAIAEHVIRTCLEKKVGVIYTAPLKALSNQKFRDFQVEFQDQIGILTGDVSINQDAPVLILTTEIFRNKVLDDPRDSMKKYSWIIFDEIHYIDNQERGTVWEESLIFLPPHMNFLGLSATIPNVGQFAQWLETIHKKPIKVVIEQKRPVPLHFFFQCNNQTVDRLERVRPKRHGPPNKLITLIRLLRERDALPCIYFVFGRRRAEYLAHELYQQNFLTAEEEVRIMELYESLLTRFDLTKERSALQLSDLIRRGIAYHHAGMLPTLKEVVERLFTSRILKVIFTTETFALGINMPSRSVIFDELRKFYGRYVRTLKTRDFYQMAGRAGRRSIDKEGFVFCRINPHMIRIDEVKSIIYGKPEEVRSQLNTSYATILNLYEAYRENLFQTYPLSFHAFQSSHNKQKEIVRGMEQKLQLLKDSAYIVDGKLTAKGRFAKSVYGYELILSELFEEGLFEELDELSLAVVASAVIYEPRRNIPPLHLSSLTRVLKKRCDDMYRIVKNAETRYRIFPPSKPPEFHISRAMEAWVKGESFAKLPGLVEVDEGELVRYFRMALQVLREIHDCPVSSPLLKGRIMKTVRLVCRDVVDAEKQLREVC